MNDPSVNHVNSTGAGREPEPRPALSILRAKVQTLRLPANVTSHQPRGARLPWILCAVLAASTLLLGGLYAFDRPAPEKAPSAAVKSSSTGPVASAGEAVLETKGYIIPVHQIQVGPKVGGLVIKLNIEEGMRVARGQVLAELETTDYQADRDQLRAQLDSAWQRYLELTNGNRPQEIEQARAELAEAESNRKQLKLDWDRNKRLNGEALAQRDFELAEYAFKSADRRVEQKRQAYQLMVIGPRAERIEAAWADMMQIDASLAKAEWRLDNCIVRAPVSGVILTKKAEEGTIVNPQAFSNGLAASLCDMADLSDLEVDLKVQERDVAKVFKGQRCRVRSEAYPDRFYEGVVSRLMPIADRAQAAVPVRVKVKVPREEEGFYLKPEMGAVVSFLKKK
jgi:HlyD family secretion protein